MATRTALTTLVAGSLLALSTSSCVFFFGRILEGPVPPPADGVVEIRIATLRGEPAPLRVIADPARVGEIMGSQVFSAGGLWQAPWSTDFRPHYQIDLVARDGSTTRYWLGAQSDPPRPPCFWLCSGWWLAASDAQGALDPARYKTLAASFELLD